MIKFVYGDGLCSIVGSNIRAVLIKFIGSIEITDKTNDSFLINYRNNKIIIFPVDMGYLGELFDYVGEFRIVSVKDIDGNLDSVTVRLTKQMHYSEYIYTRSEAITANSEDMSVGYVYGNKVNKTRIMDNIERNLHSSITKARLYLNKEPYNGYYHIHNGETYMTGLLHTKESRALEAG